MNAPSRLALYGVGLVAIFAASYAVAGAVVPESVVENWNEQSEQHPGHEMPATPAPGSPSSETPSPHSSPHDTGGH